VTDDAKLLLRFSDEGVPEAFNAFVRRHIEVVYYAALRQLEGPPVGLATRQVGAELPKCWCSEPVKDLN